MPDNLMRQFWFYENQTKISKTRRIEDFRQIGWTDPFKYTEQNLQSESDDEEHSE
jgi:hypothetical protein